jgi:cytochrome c biogenesis protein CcmG/thiol:disulfide interchange protein DsbE
MNRWWIAGAAAFGLALATIPFIADETGTRAAGQAPGQPGAKTAAAAGVCKTNPKPAPLNFTLKDMDGKQVRLADYKGKVIMLNFWATWCGPCQYEIPMFVKLQEKYRDQGVVFLGVSIDDSAPTLQTYAKQMKMNYPILVGVDHDDLQEAYGPFVGIPTTALIARDGAICTKYMGAQPFERFERDIKALL